MIEYNKEKLKEIVENSKSLNEVLKKFERNNSGAAYKSLHRFLKKWDISTSHFLTHSERLLQTFDEGKIKKILSENLFIVDPLVGRNVVKRRIIKDKLIEYKCAKCDNEGIWLGEKISLILDHINGINYDHRLENLRFVCPNCNATLKTHCKGKEGLKEKEDVIDGRTLRKERLGQRKIKDRPSLDVLESYVKLLGYSGTGRKYNVSDTTINAWIKKYKKDISH